MAPRPKLTVEQVERRVRACEMRRQGMSYEQIARAMGITQPAAWRLVKRALDRMQVESADAVIKIESTRIDHAIQRIQQGIDDGDPAAIGALVKLMDRRAKMLGLDAAQRIEMRSTDAADGPAWGGLAADPRERREQLLAIRDQCTAMLAVLDRKDKAVDALEAAVASAIGASKALAASLAARSEEDDDDGGAEAAADGAP